MIAAIGIFADYLEPVVNQVGDAAGVSMDQVKELNVVNYDARARQRDSLGDKIFRGFMAVVICTVVFFAMLGVFLLIIHF